MSRRDKQPIGFKPVKRIELSDKNVKLRTIVIILLVAVAAGAFVTGLTSVLRTEPGWQEIKAEAEAVNVSADLVLNYDFSASGAAASLHKRHLTELYTKTVEDAYRIFDVSGEEMQKLNGAVNKMVTVEPALYKALKMAAEYGNRHIFLAPVNTEYKRMFLCETAKEAALYDPAQNEEVFSYIQEIIEFVGNPEMIHLEWSEDNQAGLYVSEKYLAFTSEYELTELVDFGWLRNAFVVDYVAETLSENGYTSGYLASFDGFTRNLDSREVSYSFNIFDRLENDIYLPFSMNYQGPLAIVSLRNYPMSEADRWHYRAFENGRIATSFIDPSDGRDKSSTDNLVSYSAAVGCAEQLLRTVPLYVADELNEQELWKLKESGVHTVWFEGSKICYTEEEINLNVLKTEEMEYHIR